MPLRQLCVLHMLCPSVPHSLHMSVPAPCRSPCTRRHMQLPTLTPHSTAQMSSTQTLGQMLGPAVARQHPGNAVPQTQTLLRSKAAR